MAKHFSLTIGDDSFSFSRKEDQIAAEAALDGIYVVRTNVSAAQFPTGEVVATYKRLANVERAFRIFNGDLDVRPVHHHKADRVRAHFFLCMLAHYLEWHLIDHLAPMLFVDEDKAAAEAAAQVPGGAGAALGHGQGQGRHQAHGHWRTSPLAPDIAGRPRHDLFEPHPAHRPSRSGLRDRDHPDSAPAAGLRAARGVAPPGRRVQADSLRVPAGQISCRDLAGGKFGLGASVSGEWRGPEAPAVLARRIRLPVAFLHGEDDRFIRRGDAIELYRQGGGPRVLDIVPGAGHGFDALAAHAVTAAVQWVLVARGGAGRAGQAARVVA